jgi:hypothetical protein
VLLLKLPYTFPLIVLPRKRQFLEVEYKSDFSSLRLPLGENKVKSAVSPSSNLLSFILKAFLPRVKNEMTLTKGK